MSEWGLCGFPRAGQHEEIASHRAEVAESKA